MAEFESVTLLMKQCLPALGTISLLAPAGLPYDADCLASYPTIQQNWGRYLIDQTAATRIPRDPKG